MRSPPDPENANAPAKGRSRASHQSSSQSQARPALTQEQLAWRLAVQHLQRCEMLALLREVNRKLDVIISGNGNAGIERERTR